MKFVAFTHRKRIILQCWVLVYAVKRGDIYRENDEVSDSGEGIRRVRSGGRKSEGE
jgi:hypothetical protein